MIENNLLINQIITIKNEYAGKMNEMLEMHDSAQKKKEVKLLTNE